VRRRHLAIGIVGAVLASSCAAVAPLSPREPTPGTASFTVMTYNIHRDRSNDPSTVAAVGAPDADVVCLQEVTRAWESALRGAYATKYPHMLFAPKENAGGLAVLSRFPLEDRGVVPVPGDLHPGWIVVADAPGGRVQLVHVHLRSMFNGTSDWVSNYFATEKDHLAELALFMDGAEGAKPAAEEKLPTVVLGDFNESPSGDTVKHLEGLGFRNALPLFRPGQYTWHSPSVGGMLDMTIDHVMFDDAFEPLSAWVDRRGRSDHLPVIARLEWSPSRRDP
jgi:vancomycin resistance protein VanJ